MGDVVPQADAADPVVAVDLVEESGPVDAANIQTEDRDWTDLLTKALPALVGVVVGFLTAQTLPEIETVLGSDFTAPFVFVGIFVAIIGFVLATVFANLALRTRSIGRRVTLWVGATLAFCLGVMALAAVLSIRAQPTVQDPTPFDVELTVKGREAYESRAAENAARFGVDDAAELAEACAAAIPVPVRVVAIGGTVPSPLVVIPSDAISDELPCPSVRMRILGQRGVAIPVLES
ncbi:MAG: hypothetical protein AB8G26_15410 [Ilumatobacter sp.]